MIYATVTDFADLQRWLDSFPDQIDGDPCAICQTGEEYVVFKARHLARAADVAMVEREVAEDMRRQLSAYLDGRAGRIYWRTRFETDVSDYPVVLRFAEDGPDRDFVTNRACYLDKGWKAVAAYCRLYRAKMQTMAVEITPAQAAA